MKPAAADPAAIRHVDFLLLGGGLASATAAQALRDEGAGGSIVIVSNESVPPYNRPPLSKGFLFGSMAESRLAILSPAEYANLRIELMLDCNALSLDPRARVVRTGRGSVHYDELLIATGTSAMHLNVPGADLAGVHTLRTAADASALRAAAAESRTAVVIGASFNGLEIASTLSRLGLKVTLIDQEAMLFAKLNAPDVSRALAGYVTSKGVEIVLGDKVAELRGTRRVQQVVTAAGKVLGCDLVAVAVGVTPNVGFLEGSGLALDDGVRVDRTLKASLPHIHAAGDVARFDDPIFGRPRRVEHWDNAVKQGRVAARSMLGMQQPFDEVTYFYSDFFDMSFEMLGDADVVDERIARGSLADGSMALFYLKKDVPQALFTIGRPAAETRAAEAMIRFRVNVKSMRRNLADPSFALEKIPNQTVLILQGGGALGAFECGVVKALENSAVHPDIVAGVSIGAFNGAIIASNPRHATEALEAFWRELTVDTPIGFNPDVGQAVSSMQILAFGVPKFFQPRWWMPALFPQQWPANWVSLYDTAPMRELIAKYVDFGKLADSPVRLLVSAVNVETAELEVFDSYRQRLTVDHILASGSLPPGFAWTTIASKHYWDGGMISNSPLELVIDLCGAAGKRVFIVDLFSSRRPLPSNLMEVAARRDEIIYSERVHNDVRTRRLVRDFRALVEDIMGQLDPKAVAQMSQRPRFIQLMGEPDAQSITRIVREVRDNEPSSRDYDFSRASIERHQADGYRQAIKALGAEAAGAAKRR